jgi:hypothetical protein
VGGRGGLDSLCGALCCGVGRLYSFFCAKKKKRRLQERRKSISVTGMNREEEGRGKKSDVG